MKPLHFGKGPEPVKKANACEAAAFQERLGACEESPPVTLSRNNELGLYTPRSLSSAGLRPLGSRPRLVAALSSVLVRRLED